MRYFVLLKGEVILNNTMYQDFEKFLVSRSSPEIIEYEKQWNEEKIPFEFPTPNDETKKEEVVYLVGHKMSKPTPFHSHNFYEVIYILDGLVENITPNHSFFMGAGDICIMNLSSSHSLNTLDSEAIVFNICISIKEMQHRTFQNLFYSNNFLGEFLRDQNTLDYLYFPNTGSSKLADTIQSLLSLKTKQNPSTEFYLASQILKFFAQLIDLNEYSYVGITKSVMKILDYIKKNCSTTSLSDIAVQFNYSESYLSKLIKKHTGRPLTKIITGYRMEEACLLLVNSSLSVNDIANKVGYKSYSHFHKLFKETLKATPNDFRNKVFRDNSV